MKLRIPIQMADGSTLEDFTGYTDWRDVIRSRGTIQGKQEDFDFSRLDEQRHRAIYSQQMTSDQVWAGGEKVMHCLLSLGVKPSDRVLDLGCGAGRVGVHLIQYLNHGNYYGVDSHKHALIAFSAYEAPKYGVADKGPSLMFDDQFRVKRFGVTFDVIFDSMTLFFVKHHQFVRAMQKIGKCTHRGTRLLSSWNDSPNWNLLEEAGWRLEKVAPVGQAGWRIVRPCVPSIPRRLVAKVKVIRNRLGQRSRETVVRPVSRTRTPTAV